MENSDLITSFYDAFAGRDHEAMAACYAADVRFSDPVFDDLRGDEARAMWHMLCEQGTDLRVTYRNVEASATTGTAHWDATYTFSPTGRTVHNSIDATFVLRDGLIVEHHDTFDLWRWMRMALGPIGVITGWSAMGKQKVREAGATQLDRFLAHHPEYVRPDSRD